jgi:hypothetical protein
MDELTKASHKLAEEVYKQSAGKQGGGPGAGPESGPEQGGPQGGPQGASGSTGNGGHGKTDDVIDAEFREEKK